MARLADCRLPRHRARPARIWVHERVDDRYDGDVASFRTHSFARDALRQRRVAL